MVRALTTVVGSDGHGAQHGDSSMVGQPSGSGSGVGTATHSLPRHPRQHCANANTTTPSVQPSVGTYDVTRLSFAFRDMHDVISKAGRGMPRQVRGQQYRYLNDTEA